MNRKIHLLFVIPSLTAGGGEKSLMNLLSQIDYDRYQVDLVLFNRSGLFLASLPEEVRLLDLPESHRTFCSGLPRSIGSFIKQGRLTLAYSRLMFSLKNRTMRHQRARSEQRTWKYFARSLEVLGTQYDAAIGYLEKSSVYFVVDKVKAKKKIGWIHTNYGTSGMDQHFDYPYFQQLDHIVTVSEECARSLESHFADFKHKVKVIYNIVSPVTVRRLAQAGEAAEMARDRSLTKIVSVARLSDEKGIDLAIGACRLLVERGAAVQWYVLGDGQERQKLEMLIESSGLTEHFHLLGTKENPYPYIQAADIYVQPSRYEGKSIALDEAKILLKPIVVTSFETAKDQIQDGVDGMIVAMNEEGLCEGLEALIRDRRIQEQLTLNLSKQQLGTEEEIRKLYEIIQ
ncbi:glycosyltransferase [Paenibacillus chartarius]|uniref:Glycosyltransferase n=1 Tax=Paenibacillus chartarius TaxID=747481 RepID=A0ABV6DUX3_9BACL